MTNKSHFCAKEGLTTSNKHPAWKKTLRWFSLNKGRTWRIQNSSAREVKITQEYWKLWLVMSQKDRRKDISHHLPPRVGRVKLIKALCSRNHTGPLSQGCFIAGLPANVPPGNHTVSQLRLILFLRHALILWLVPIQPLPPFSWTLARWERPMGGSQKGSRSE